MKFKFKKSKIIISLVVALALFAGTCMPASAYTEYTTNWTYSSGYYNSYQFRPYLQVYTNSIFSVAHIKTVSGGIMFPNEVELMALLYKSNGTLKSNSGMMKLWISSSTFKNNTSTTDSGTYYATAWYGIATDKSMTTYNIYAEPTYTTNATFTANAIENLVSDSEGYSVNSNGETYGSGMLASVYGEAPDLIEAEGVHGTIGYVRYDDLIQDVTTIEDNSIPVYDLDGNVIDKFEFSNTIDDGELVPADPTPIA